ncbi:MAG: AI-2E family transporter [Tissierellia bacterium]|nr:AI-2E family transporter [Tissierellia bacterium]
MEQLRIIGDFIASDYLRAIQSVLISIFLALAIYYLINIGNQRIERSLRININLKLVSRIVGVLIGLFILRYIFNRFPILGSTIWALVVSVIMAYIINPAVDYFQNKGLPRQLGVIIVYLGVALTLVILGIVVVPRTITELSRLFLIFPELADQVSDWFTNFSNNLSQSTSIDLQNIIDRTESQFINFMDLLEGQMVDGIKDLAYGLQSFIEGLISFALVLIFTFFFSVEKEAINQKISKSLPKKHEKDIVFLAREIDRMLKGFIQGRLVLAILVGFMTMVMLLILRIDFAIVIGIVTIVADFIPYLGPFIALSPAFIFALLDSRLKALWVAILFVGLQWVENNILGPRILGKRTGLHPMVILLCIIIGGGMYGVAGLILSVPIFSVVLVIKDFALLKWAQNKELKEDLKL